MFSLNNYVHIPKKERLNSYSYSRGGGMRGGFSREVVRKVDDKNVILTEEFTEWHAQDPRVTEYLTDASVLSGLENVFRKSRMNFWHRKKFTNIFVCDGESESYSFSFGNHYVGFSSQIYPKKYGNKLARLDEVLDACRKNAVRLPGLVNEYTDMNEPFSCPEGEIAFHVSRCCYDCLEVVVFNETDEPIELPYANRLLNADTGEEVAVYEDSDTVSVGAGERYVYCATIRKLLNAGHYQLMIGDRTVPFELR